MSHSTDAAERAAEWFSRQETGELTAAQRTDFQAWLAASPEHAREYETIQRMWATYAQVSVPPVLDKALPANSRRVRVSRHVLGSIVAASFCALAVVASSDIEMRWRADFATSVGEVRTVTLPDGSLVKLNTSSAIKLSYAADRRFVELLAGEADFHVAPDRERPFIVEAAGGTTRALGTEFVVRRGEAGATVTVLEHNVVVSYGGSGDSLVASVTVGPGGEVTYGREGGLRRARSVDPDDAHSWRRGWLSFEDRPLREVVAEIDRYVPGWLRVIDPSLGELRVTCVIPLDRADKLVDSLEPALGVRVLRVTDYLTLIRD